MAAVVVAFCGVRRDDFTMGGEITQAILYEEPKSKEIVFNHSVLCQVTLPRAATNDFRYVRSCGKVSLLLKAGDLWDGGQWVQQSLPSGTRPRLFLLWLCTELIRKEERHIPLGNSISGFLRDQLNIAVSGGPNGSLTRFRNEIAKLAACNFKLGTFMDGMPGTVNISLVDSFYAWLSSEEVQPSFFDAHMVVKESFLESICAHGVPLDLRAVRAMKTNALALDFYSFLSYRLHRVPLGQPLRLPWGMVMAQFAPEYTRRRNFKQKALEALTLVHQFYPQGRFTPTKDYLILHHSAPPVLKKIYRLK